MTDTGDTSPGEPRSVIDDVAVDDDIAAAGGRFDAFICYRRISPDVAFVDRLQNGLAERGKRTWVDRANIEPASDWLQRVTRGIEAAKALIFVITPESVASPECRREFEMAAEWHKLIIPVVLRSADLQSDILPGLSRLNWISCTSGHDEQRALDDVVRALEEDLDWRDAHTRLEVRAREWADLARDRSFLLRGSDLRSSEEWLGQAAQHVKTPPTPLQAEYIVASRKAANRAQRNLRAALGAGLVAALVLAGVALVQRNHATTEARLAQARALAAQATADLSTNPGQSLSLALNAMKLDSGGPEEQALRMALAQDRMRMVIRSGTGSATVAAWDAGRSQVAVTAPHDSVALWNTATGRLTQTLPTGHSVDQLLFNASGSRLVAVSSAGYVSMWDISPRGSASPIDTSRLHQLINSTQWPATDSLPPLIRGSWAGENDDQFDVFSVSLKDVLAFNPETSSVRPILEISPSSDYRIWTIVPSPDGSELLIAGGDGTSYFLKVATGSLTPLSPLPDTGTFGPICWFPDRSAVVTSTATNLGGPDQIYSVQGALIAQLPPSHGPTTAMACSASASHRWMAAGDERGDVMLRLAGGTVVPLYGHNGAISAIASSPDGQYLASAGNDGTARVWNADTGQPVTILTGDGAPLKDIQFGPGDGLVLTVDDRGLVRVWDTGVGQPVTALQSPPQGQAVVFGFAAGGQQVVGADLIMSAGAAARVASAYALTWDARSGRLVRRVALPGIEAAPEPCSPDLKSVGGMRVLQMVSGSECAIPPPPDLVLAAPVPRPVPGYQGNADVELLPLVMSPDNRYVAYTRFHAVALLDSRGRQVAILRLGATPTGLSFYDGSAGLVVMTNTAIYLWKPLSGRPPLVIPQSSTPIDAAVSGDRDRLAVAGGGKTISVWNMSSGRLIRTFRPVTSSARPRQYRPTPIPLRVAITGNGDVVASGDSDGTVCLWNVATGKLIAADTLSGYAVVELNSAASGSAFLAVDWPDVVSGVLPPGTGHVLDPSTGKVLASFKYPETPEPVINPGAALSADGRFLLAGVTGLAPAPPGGFEATYQVSTGQPMTNLQSVVQSGNVAYSESPVRPWAPDGDEVLAGTAIYPCDACGTTDTVLAAAASRIAWSQPLSASNDHPPATNPYR